MAEEKKETLSDELVSLLKINNKGWKTTLFQDTRKIETMICGNCKGICDNATEFDCDDDHDDAELYFYCRKCIQELIISHNGNCPINEHSKPKISRSRTANRRIKKSMVFCPYSKQYQIKEMKNKKQNNNAQVVDTMGEDEKEGIAIAANDQNEPELSFINGCSFNGKFDDLLINHFKECVEKYNPYFLMNITIRKLEYENKLKTQKQNKTPPTNINTKKNNENNNNNDDDESDDNMFDGMDMGDDDDDDSEQDETPQDPDAKPKDRQRIMNVEALCKLSEEERLTLALQMSMGIINYN